MKGNRKYTRRSLFILWVMIALLTGACTSRYPSNDRVVEVEDRITGDKSVIGGNARKAQVLSMRGEYGKAAEVFRRLADEAESESLEQHYRLWAADAYARNEQNDHANSQGKRLKRSGLSKEHKLLAKIVQAQLAINKGRAREAFSILPQRAEAMGLEYQIRLAIVRADAWLGLNRYSDAVLERIDIDPLITDSDARVLNHQWIWNQLQNMPRQEVFSPPSGMSMEDAGWWSLAAIVKKGDYQHVRGPNEIDVWRDTYPGHPATEDILFLIESDPTAPKLEGRQYSGTGLEGTPQQVALLLPFSGDYAEAGRSVLRGFRDAASASHYGAVNYKVYDSTDPAHPLGAIAKQAVADGAEMIVGPLQKKVLSELISAGDVGVPVLALNTLPDSQQAVEGLFQFGLSPENDAAEVATKAVNDGQYRAVVLVSQDVKGKRLGNAFIDAYEKAGGRVVSYLSFPPNSNNLSQTVKKLLRAGTKDPLWQDDRKDTPRRRSDQQIDMAFFTASPRDARLIRPMLQLHRGVDLPVYSTARVYSRPDVEVDKDLNGLVFCDMPMKFAGEKKMHQLAALGADAFLLVNQLEGLLQSPGSEIPGKTGALSVTHTGQIWRNLDCAVFRKGKAQLLR